MATTKTFYSSWQSVPNGGARYRLKLTLSVASQNVSANTSTIAYELRIEKDRSWSSGFYDYFANWGVSLNGVEVSHQDSVQWPNAIWNGWSSWLITSGRYTITHADDGDKTIAVAADWSRSASGWSPGTMTISGQSMDLPTIPRATVPTVSPSPAVVGGFVTIDLPRVVGTYTHDITWEAGAASGALMAQLGQPLPVSPRKRSVFSFRAPLRVENFPMLFDNSGIWIRPEGQGFIGGIQPPADRDPDATGDFEPHHDLFQDVFWPALATRIPAMAELRLERSWAGHYEVNALDHNGILGPHDEIATLVFSTGFSGHGVMHAPAAGRAVAEIILTGGFVSLDLSPLGYARIRSGRPMPESIVY